MFLRGGIRFSEAVCCALVLGAALASPEAPAQTSTVRANTVVLNLNANSPAVVASFLTSSWGQLYWIDSSSGGHSLEMDTGDGTSINVGSLSSSPNSDYLFGFGGMVNGPDGAIWLTGTSTSSASGNCINQIYRLSTGDFTVYPLSPPACSQGTGGIAAGSDGALWFTLPASVQIGRITTTGVITEFAPPCNVLTNGIYNTTLQPPIVSGTDGNLWFECVGNSDPSVIYKMTTAGQFTGYPLPAGYGLNSAGNLEAPLAVGADGNIWFSAYHAQNSVVGSVSPAGAFNFYSLPASTDAIKSIVAGPDSALWATGFGSALGRITTSGQVSLVPMPSNPSFANFQCQPITVNAIGLGPKGSLVFDASDDSFEGSCYLGSLTPGQSSLWPATGTASAAATVRAARVHRTVQTTKVQVNAGQPNLPVTCWSNFDCDIQLTPASVTTRLVTLASGDIVYDVPIVGIHWQAEVTPTYTVGMRIILDPPNASVCNPGAIPYSGAIALGQQPIKLPSGYQFGILKIVPISASKNYDCVGTFAMFYTAQGGVPTIMPHSTVTLHVTSLGK